MRIFHSCLLFLLVLSFLPAEECRIDAILASVNGVPVSLFDVLLESWKEERKLAVVFKGEKLEQEIKRIRKKVAMEIIERKLIYKEFEKYEYAIPQQLIEDALGELALDFSDGSIKGLQKKAESYGSNITELREKAREKVAVGLIINEICYRNIHVTPKDVYEYYQKNLDKFRQPASLQIQSLFLEKGKRDQEEEKKVIGVIGERLADRKVNFSELVSLYSDGPKDNSGILGWIKDDKLRNDFTPVKAVKKRETAGPIITDEGIYFLYLTDKVDAEVITYTKAKDDIQRELENNTRRKRYEEYIGDLKKNALIRYYF